MHEDTGMRFEHLVDFLKHQASMLGIDVTRPGEIKPTNPLLVDKPNGYQNFYIPRKAESAERERLSATALNKAQFESGKLKKLQGRFAETYKSDE